MILDKETLIEIQDYINHLDEFYALLPETLEDIADAIAEYKKIVLNKRN